MIFLFGFLIGAFISFILTATIEAKTGTPSYIVETVATALAIPFITIGCFIWNPIKNVVQPCPKNRWEEVAVKGGLNYVNLTKSIYYVRDPDATRPWNKRFFVRVKD